MCDTKKPFDLNDLQKFTIAFNAQCILILIHCTARAYHLHIGVRTLCDIHTFNVIVANM